MTKHRGSCLCGQVQFELGANPGQFGYCHCRACQKASGSAHAANAPIARRHFRVMSGADAIREFESSPGKIRAFCSGCGSPLYAFLANSPGRLRIRLGLLDTAFKARPKAHTWVAEKAPWDRIADMLPQFDTWAPRDVLYQKGSRQDLLPD